MYPPGRELHESTVKQPHFTEQDARHDGDVSQLKTKRCIEGELFSLDTQHAGYRRVHGATETTHTESDHLGLMYALVSTFSLWLGVSRWGDVIAMINITRSNEYGNAYTFVAMTTFESITH